MPLVDGDFGLLAEHFEPGELVVDKGLQWPNINRADTPSGFFDDL